MTRDTLPLPKSDTPSALSLPAAPRIADYAEIVRRLFRTRSVIAVIGAASGSRSDEACRGIAAAVAASGRSTVIAGVQTILAAVSLPSTSFWAPGRDPNVSLWPPADAASRLDPLSQNRLFNAQSDWITPLGREFDAVLLDCPPREAGPGGVEIAGMADAAVLVVESGVTTKQQIDEDQHYAQIRGVKLAGCIMMQRR